MMDLLLPRTDAGVAVQFGVFVTFALATVVRVRRRPEWLVLAIGTLLLGLGLFGVRAVH